MSSMAKKGGTGRPMSRAKLEQIHSVDGRWVILDCPLHRYRSVDTSFIAMKSASAEIGGRIVRLH